MVTHSKTEYDLRIGSTLRMDRSTPSVENVAESCIAVTGDTLIAYREDGYEESDKGGCRTS